jgi:hypothetical protein
MHIKRLELLNSTWKAEGLPLNLCVLTLLLVNLVYHPITFNTFFFLFYLLTTFISPLNNEIDCGE